MAKRFSFKKRSMNVRLETYTARAERNDFAAFSKRPVMSFICLDGKYRRAWTYNKNRGALINKFRIHRLNSKLNEIHKRKHSAKPMSQQKEATMPQAALEPSTVKSAG